MQLNVNGHLFYYVEDDYGYYYFPALERRYCSLDRAYDAISEEQYDRAVDNYRED